MTAKERMLTDMLTKIVRHAGPARGELVDVPAVLLEQARDLLLQLKKSK